MSKKFCWRALPALLLAVAIGVLGLPALAKADASDETVTLNAQFSSGEGVSDEVTTLKVYKLDTDTQEPVSGARLQIIEKGTGTVVREWTSSADNDGMIEVAKQLNVDTRYLLREVEAPAGYEKAADTEFYLTSGSDHFSTELVVVGGPATVVAHDGSDAQIKLTNTKSERVVETEEVVDRTNPQQPSSNTTTTEQSRSGSGRLAQTSDQAVPALVLGGIVVAGLVIIGIAVYRRRNDK